MKKYFLNFLLILSIIGVVYGVFSMPVIETGVNIVFAQGNTGPDDVLSNSGPDDILGNTGIDSSSYSLIHLFVLLRSLINLIIPLLFALAVVFFLFGIFKYFFLHADQPEKREEGRKFILWGIIALFVMVSFWGLVNILSNTFFGVRVPDPGDTSWRQDSEQIALLASVREGRSVVRV